MTGCSTKKNTLVNRNFHNLTARYNGYFHAKEAIKEGVVKLEASHLDDYSRILPIYKLSDDKAAKSIYPEMDKAFKKASLVIQRHSMMIRGTEYVKWIDDNYLAIGISHYYKRDYFAAIEVFDYILKQYKKSEIKYDAMTWLIRTYNEAGIVSKAQMLIDMLDNDKKFPKRIRPDLDLAIADFYLKKEDYSMSAKYIEKAIPNLKKKKVKTRMYFILAQLYQKTGVSRKALTCFAEVIRMNPSYEMAFQAKIAQAKSFDASASTKKDIKAQLTKMLKDQKNKEYYDQIYYALAEIAVKEKNQEQAIKYLNLSLTSSIDNQRQKALTYLLLADIYFIQPQYAEAQAYYDSCATVLPESYPDYQAIMTKRENLTALIGNLTTIAREDSLQRIAQMNELDREKFIDKLIDKLIKAEEKKKADEEAMLASISNQPLIQNNTNDPGTSAGQAGGAWYFYNQSAMSFGFAEFRKKWGDRKLEDHWRRSVKNMTNFSNFDDEEDNPAEATVVAKNSTNPFEALKNKDNYLKDLPLTDSLIKISNEKIIDAYFNAGSIYKEQLNDGQNAIKILEEFVGRFPSSKHLLPSYYQLYRCNLAIENQKRADYYKNILLTRYPNSEYSKIILNPDLAKSTTASKSEIESFYQETYDKYLVGEFSTVLNNCLKADTSYSKSAYSGRFSLLKALVIGRTQGINAYESALKEITILYPTDPIKDKAEEILAHIQKIKPQETDTVPSKFNLDNLAEHNCIMIVPKSTNLNDLKIAISDFNTLFFSTSQLKITNLLFDDNSQLVVISGFADKAKSMNYYSAIKENGDVLKNTGGSPQFYAISLSNFNVFYTDRIISEYKNFFEKAYLGKK
jgi:tetratricopeptide (TPR) repeat protein